MKKFFLSSAALATMAVVYAPAAVQAQEVTLRMHNFIPPVANPAKLFLIPWGKKVEAASKGRIKIQHFWTMQLGGTPPQLVTQVKDGVVDITFTLPGYTAGRFPKTEVFELPFVHTTTQATTAAIQDFQDKHLKDEWSAYHVLLLNNHAGSLIQSKKPVLKMADFKNLKIRTATRSGGLFLKSMGAVPVGAPLPKIPQLLSKGVIDGALLPYEIAPAVKMQDLVSHFSILEGKQPRLNTSVFSFLMNKGSYAKLPPDLKKVIDDHSGRNISPWASQLWADSENPGRKVMASKSKNKFHVIPASEVAKMREAAKPAIAQWISAMKGRGINGQVLLDDARAMVAKYTK
ncbi:MAG: TRAP transporter substrate-binding protein [Rhodospirillales bacterium]|jgi:TRAP-type C4-dicarboxylate transport system substrate-binding protein